jgi:hypothetical protein
MTLLVLLPAATGAGLVPSDLAGIHDKTRFNWLSGSRRECMRAATLGFISLASDFDPGHPAV